MREANPIPLTITQNGDPVLRQEARSVSADQFGSPDLERVLTRMIQELESCEDGVAIAAPQIGESLRIFIVSHRAFEIEAEEERNRKERDIPKKKRTPIPRAQDLICINPEIINMSKKRVIVPEGCLSVRWIYGKTLRSDKATIRAFDVTGKPFTRGGSGLLAQIFQHETDHLNGILFIDHATDLEEITPKRRTGSKLPNHPENEHPFETYPQS